MNQFFYESRGKEKVNDLMKEGMRGQALKQSRATRTAIGHNLPRLALTILGLGSILGILLRG